MKVQLNVRIEKKDLKRIQKLAVKRGEDSSDLVRRAIRRELGRSGFLQSEEVRALEIEAN